MTGVFPAQSQIDKTGNINLQQILPQAQPGYNVKFDEVYSGLEYGQFFTVKAYNPVETA